jgi:hypothetical protein
LEPIGQGRQPCFLIAANNAQFWPVQPAIVRLFGVRALGAAPWWQILLREWTSVQ